MSFSSATATWRKKNRILVSPRKNSSESNQTKSTVACPRPIVLAQYFADNSLAPDQQVELINNAAHLPRAMRLAQREGLNFNPLPYAHYRQAWYFEPVRIIPTVRGIFTTTTACYEILARAAGQ
jgi:hypothetical protein